jgi:hypothetical protein
MALNKSKNLQTIFHGNGNFNDKVAAGFFHTEGHYIHTWRRSERHVKLRSENPEGKRPFGIVKCR